MEQVHSVRDNQLSNQALFVASELTSSSSSSDTIKQAIVAYFLQLRRPIPRRLGILILGFQVLQTVTIVAPASSEIPLNYDTIGFAWVVLNCLCRPDVLISYTTSSLIWSTVLQIFFLTLVLFLGILTTYRKALKNHSKREGETVSADSL
jgi:hypothetical protein